MIGRLVPESHKNCVNSEFERPNTESPQTGYRVLTKSIYAFFIASFLCLTRELTNSRELLTDAYQVLSQFTATTVALRSVADPSDWR